MRTYTEHVPEDRLERYASNGDLPEPELSLVESHLLACSVCQDRLARLDATRATADEDAAQQKLSAAIPLWQAHPTRDGLVRLWVQAIKRSWAACLRGRQLDCRFSCGTQGMAVDTCARALRELYPEHRCRATCVSRAAVEAGLTTRPARNRKTRGRLGSPP